MSMLRFMIALVVLRFVALFAIQPAVTITEIHLNRHQRRSIVRAARRQGEGNVDLSKKRAWFAVGDPGMTKQADLNGLYNTIYEDAVFVAREETLMTNLVTTFGAMGYANRVVPIYAQGTAQTVADGVDYSNPRKVSKSTKATFTPSEVMAQALLTDRDMKTDPDSAQAAATFELGRSVAEKVDKDLLALLATFSNGKGAAGSAMTLSYCAAALAVVRKNKGRGEASTVLHPFQWFDIWTELGKPAANQAFLGDTANEALREYYVGRFIRMNWYETDNIATDSGDGAYGGVFTRDSMAIDIRDAMSLRPERDESLRATELNMHMGYAVGLLWSERGAYLLSDATEPAG